MNIRIKKNDYVQPTEVRERIVQDICDIMLSYTDKSLPLTVFAKDNALYLGTTKDGQYKTVTHATSNSIYDCVRIHGTEMDAAFKAFQDAGYFISARGRYKDGSAVELPQRLAAHQEHYERVQDAARGRRRQRQAQRLLQGS